MKYIIFEPITEKPISQRSKVALSENKVCDNSEKTPSKITKALIVDNI